MRRIPLDEFAAEKGQTDAARLLGMSQAALNKALRSGRSVLVTSHEDGSFTGEEVRPFPSTSRRVKAASSAAGGPSRDLEISISTERGFGQCSDSAVNPSSVGAAQ